MISTSPTHFGEIWSLALPIGLLGLILAAAAFTVTGLLKRWPTLSGKERKVSSRAPKSPASENSASKQ